MAKLLNVTEAVKLLKTTRPTFYKAIKRGTITAVAQENGPKFDPATLRRDWRKWEEYGRLQSRHLGGANKGGRPAKAKKNNNHDPAGKKSGGESDAEKLIKAKTLQATVAAERANLELQKERGELVAVAEVRKQGAKLGGILMGALNAMPSRIAPQVAHLADVHAIHEIIQQEIDRMIISVRYECGMDAES